MDQHNPVKHIKTKLSNGLTILYMHTKNDPISACHLFFPFGSSEEKSNDRGLSNLMWSLLLKGTKKRSAKKIIESIESLGAYAGAGTNQDYSSLSFHSISEYFEQTMDIVVECLFQPAYSQNEVQKEKIAQVAAIKSKSEQIFTVTHETCNKSLFTNHPYAYASSGTEDSVSGLRSDIVHKWHNRVTIPNQAVLSIASSVPFDKFLPILEKRFGPNTWEIGDTTWRRAIGHLNPLKDQIDVVQNFQFEQAYYMLAYQAPPISSRHYPKIKVINGLLGGGMSARLFQTLREKQGLGYEVGSFYPSKKRGSGLYFYLGLQPARMEQAEESIQNEIQKIINEPVSEEELKQIKNYLKGTFILDHQTNSQRAHYLGWWEILGLSSDFDAQYLQEIESVTPQHVQTVAKEIFSASSVSVKTLPKEARQGVKVPG